MRKVLIGVAVLALAVSGVFAGSATAPFTATNSQAAQSADLYAHGWLDRVEISQDADATSRVVVATYDAAGTAVDTFVSITAVGNKVVRPRFVGTDTGGTDLAAAVGAYAVSTNELGQSLTNWVATATIVIPRERAMIGGNLKAVVDNSNASDGTNAIQVRVFFDPVKR